MASKKTTKKRVEPLNNQANHIALKNKIGKADTRNIPVGPNLDETQHGLPRWRCGPQKAETCWCRPTSRILIN